MEELDRVPETSFEKDVVLEEEEAFCLSRENITSLKLLICQVRTTGSPVFKTLAGMMDGRCLNVVSCLSLSWRNARHRTRPHVKVTVRRSSSCGVDCKFPRRRGRPSTSTWSHLERGTWKRWEDANRTNHELTTSLNLLPDTDGCRDHRKAVLARDKFASFYNWLWKRVFAAYGAFVNCIW